MTLGKGDLKMNILVSACLLGVNCKYNGGNNIVENIIKLKEKYNIIPICPEQLGGLATPREPSEINVKNNKMVVISNCGNDLTKEFLIGAEESLKIAKMLNCRVAILKERSPSCGTSKIYDGKFQGNIINGMGITAKLFLENGIKLYNENDFINI